MKPVKLSNQIALTKLQQYCAYQDRSHAEVRRKLISLEIYGDDLEEVVSALIQEKYLDELRFAKSYARGKFYQKKWGRNKIKQNLSRHQISDYCFRKAMEEIDEADYISTLHSLMKKKIDQCRSDSMYVCIQKAQQYCLQKGYESHLVYEVSSEWKS